MIWYEAAPCCWTHASGSGKICGLEHHRSHICRSADHQKTADFADLLIRSDRDTPNHLLLLTCPSNAPIRIVYMYTRGVPIWSDRIGKSAKSGVFWWSADLQMFDLWSSKPQISTDLASEIFKMLFSAYLMK